MAKNWLFNIVVCQQCLGRLDLTVKDRRSNDEVSEGILTCKNCNIDYPIAKGIVFFGVPINKACSRLKEIEKEFIWNFKRTSLAEHLNYGQEHTPRIASILRRVKNVYFSEEGSPLVLDVGAGAGAISYLLARLGFKAVATELGPENLAVGESYVREAYFERVASDCSVLPYASSIFDMVLCKELAHHIDDLQTFFHELVRVLKPSGVLVLVEPFKPKFKLFSESLEYDEAKEAGLSHQDYILSDYLVGLRTIDLQVREMSLIVFRGQRHPNLVQLYHFVEKLVGAHKCDGGMWFKNLVALP
jgi:2-polyprenyl-3-methyl-5-hydroxy-6-metoxy-1,4-benzoquinol methylase/uncharacterized protein YbaR (Trm112 family)